MDRDRFMSADEAKEYGIVDNVLSVSSFPLLNQAKKD
jgi:ATP-dependent protease ClpP protease subunit